MTKRHTQTYDPIDAPGPRPTAQAGSVCTSNDKTGPRPFPQMHSQRRKLAKVAHQTCPVADCAADAGQPCIRVTGPCDDIGTPQPAVHYRREHGAAAARGAHR